MIKKWIRVGFEAFTKGKTIIGWRECLSLPDLGIKAINAKIDTGARTSALHAEEIKIVRRGSRRWVKFTVVPERVGDLKPIRAQAELVEKRKVKSSLGHASLRPVIKTTIQFGDLIWPIEITLVNRDPMGFRMLLGRSAISGNFIVDPSRSFLVGKKPAGH